MTKITEVVVGSRIVIRVYYSGKAHDVVTSMRRHPTKPAQFAGFQIPRAFDGITKLALRVDGRQIASIDLDLWDLRLGDEIWFSNRMNEV